MIGTECPPPHSSPGVVEARVEVSHDGRDREPRGPPKAFEKSACLVAVKLEQAVEGELERALPNVRVPVGEVSSVLRCCAALFRCKIDTSRRFCLYVKPA